MKIRTWYEIEQDMNWGGPRKKGVYGPRKKQAFLSVVMPKDLKEWAKARADDLGMPVSSYVRRLLEKAQRGE